MNFDGWFKDNEGSIVTIGMDEYGNIIGILGEILQFYSAQVVEPRILSLAIGIVKAIDVHDVIVEGDCKTANYYITLQPNQLLWKAKRFL